MRGCSRLIEMDWSRVHGASAPVCLASSAAITPPPRSGPEMRAWRVAAAPTVFCVAPKVAELPVRHKHSGWRLSAAAAAVFAATASRAAASTADLRDPSCTLEHSPAARSPLLYRPPVLSPHQQSLHGCLATARAPCWRLRTQALPAHPSWPHTWAPWGSRHWATHAPTWTRC